MVDAPPSAPSKWKRVGSIITQVASIAGIISLPVGILAIREAWQIADASGDLAKSKIVFGFGNYASSQAEIDVIAIISRRCHGSPVLMELPIMLSNQGDKLASDVSVSLQFPLEGKSSPALPAEISDAYSMDGPPITTLRRTVSDSKKWRYVTYTISRLQSKSLANMVEVMQAPLPVSVDINEIDKRFVGTLHFEYAIQIPVTIASGDDIDVRKIMLSTVRANSLEEAKPQIDAYMRNQASKESKDNAGNSLIGRWFKPRLNHEVFILYPEDSTCDRNVPLTQTHLVKSVNYSR